MRRIFTVPRHSQATDLMLALLRVVAGMAFMFHGWGKIQNPLGWMGEDSWAPGIFQALAALSEFGGGLAWTMGFLTPLASLGVACTMVVAAWLHAIVRGDPFVGHDGSYELAAVYLCISLLFLAAGPGRFSLDHKVFGSRS